jgi:hypothetical protein
MADCLAGHFEGVFGVARHMAQRPRPQHERLAADLDGHFAFDDPEHFILVRVDVRRRAGTLGHPVLD